MVLCYVVTEIRRKIFWYNNPFLEGKKSVPINQKFTNFSKNPGITL